MPEKRHFLMNLMHGNNKKSPLIINLSLGYPAGPRNNGMFIKITGFFLKTRFLNIPSQLKFGPKRPRKWLFWWILCTEMVRIKLLIVYLSLGHPRNNGLHLQNTLNTRNFDICVIIITKSSKLLLSQKLPWKSSIICFQRVENDQKWFPHHLVLSG